MGNGHGAKKAQRGQGDKEMKEFLEVMELMNTLMEDFEGEKVSVHIRWEEDDER